MEKISWWRTTFGNEEAQRIVEALSNEHVSQGPITKQFEEQFAESLGVPYAVATTSGSVALLMAMIAMDIGPGDEVIVPNRTWIATAHAVAILGATVKVIDVVPEIPAIDTSQIRQAITSKTKAIISVQLSGRSSNMEEIRKIANEYNLSIVEDACQSVFSKNAQGFLGTQSDIGCFSLGISKLLSTAQGGIIVTKDRSLYEKLILIRSHGTTTNITPTYAQLGCNFKYTDLQAAMGIVQLKHRQEKIDHVKKIYLRYSEAIETLSEIEIIPIKVAEGEVPLFMEALCNDRPGLMSFLEDRGIEIRPFLPNITMAKHLKSTGSFPNSDIFHHRGIFLPCGPAQPLDNIDRVIKGIHEYCKQ